MGFSEAVKSVFSNYVTFSGRAPRSEYWYFCLFVFLVSIGIGIVEGVIGTEVIGSLFSLAVLLPSIAVSVRRLHDIDKSGWWLLICLIPLIGMIILLIWACSKGTDGDNRYGSDPLRG